MDTNILSDVIRNPDGVVARHIEKVGPKEIFTNLIVAAELRYGCSNKGSPKLLARVKGLLETIPVLPMDTPLDIEYGRIRSELEAAGQTIGINDLLIASHASALGLTMVTDNTSEFSRIQGLRVENWLRD